MVLFAAKLTGNKYCSVKEKRNVTISPAMVVDDEYIGSGSHLNINNLSKEDYAKLCESLKVNRLSGDLPIFIELKLAETGYEKDAWRDQYEPKDDDDDQETQEETTDDKPKGDVPAASE